MSKYIDADTLIKSTVSKFKCVPLVGVSSCRNGEECFDGEAFDDLINNTPSADVVEVKHSIIKWVNRPISAQYATVTDEYGEKHYGKVCDRIENNPVGYCGECGKRLDDTFMNFCPNCGAKMDGERREQNEG